MNLQPPPEDATPWEKDLYEFLKYPVYPGPVKINGAFTINNISFPATAVPSTDANTLDDYEEGTWTPSLGGTETYTTQTGTYTKIGDLVTVLGIVSINAIGTGSTTTMSGLPFACGTVRGSISVSYWATIATNIAYVSGNITAAASTIVLYSTVVAAANPTTNAFFQNSATIHFSGSYKI